MRRSRKNRSAPRVAFESSAPNTWMLGIFLVGVLPSGAGIDQAPTGSSGSRANTGTRAGAHQRA